MDGSNEILIGDGTQLMPLPNGLHSEIQDDGTTFAIWSESPQLLILRFTVLTIGAKPPAKATDIDITADVVGRAKREGQVAVQIGDKTWYSTESDSVEGGQMIWVRFWYVGYKNRMIIVSLTCKSQDKNNGTIHYVIGLVPEIIRGVKIRAETSSLAEQESSILDNQRNLVRDTLRTRYGVYSLPSLMADLSVLQQILDDRVFSPEQEYEWSSVGVVFGDIIANELGLRWVAHCDEHGAEPALNLDGTSIKIFPRPMVLKRIEKGEAMDLRHQLEQLGAHIAKLKREGY